MFCQLDESFVSEFQTGNYTYNAHKFSIDPKKFETDEKMKEFWTYTSTSKDGNGREFVATMEAKNYPIFGTQFHPEKTTQIFYEKRGGINHSWQSIKMNRYFADLFVQMARANTNSFGTYEETQPYLI
jgi:gamma-glutamyl hydrolase|tara:strand:- start:122 stop:505 length:384 start_codon:yes stop_codon:yes gene_type:complete